MAIGAIVLGALMGPTLGQGQTDPTRETVTVGASGAVEVPPDLARVSLGVHEEASTAQEAAQRLSDSTNRVIDALKAAGYSEDQLTVRDVSVFPIRKKDVGIVGYAGSTAVVVKTADLEAIGDIIDTGVTAGANTVRGVDFEIDEASDAIKQALRQAMEFALEKGDVLATTAGRTLGRALIIREGGSRPARTVSVAGATFAGRSRGGGTPQPFPIIPPDITVSAHVVVTFALQ
jgi:uncharacterized protein YggE